MGLWKEAGAPPKLGKYSILTLLCSSEQCPHQLPHAGPTSRSRMLPPTPSVLLPLYRWENESPGVETGLAPQRSRAEKGVPRTLARGTLPSSPGCQTGSNYSSRCQVP